MAKVRVGEIAKELNLKASEALAKLKEMGITVKSNLSAIDDETVRREIMTYLEGGTESYDLKRKKYRQSPSKPKRK